MKIIAIAAGLTGLLGGALLSMGHLRTAESDFQQLEMSKLRNLAGNWESKLLSVRSAFRDQMLRQNVTAIVEHPADWAAWRVENKIQLMVEKWPAGLTKPRAWVLLRGNGTIHAQIGDTTGLTLALDGFAKPNSPDILLGDPEAGRDRFLALQYAPPIDPQNQTPGQLIALVAASDLFALPDDPPVRWVLMNGPKDAFLASARGESPPIGAGTWGILLSQAYGLVTMEEGLPIAYCRIHVPGMDPLLVVSEIAAPTGAGSALGALLLMCVGTVFLVAAFRARKTETPGTSSAEASESGEDQKQSPETVTFRQIFHAARTPLCVVDTGGRLLRVNASARELFSLPKGGQPDDSVTVIGSEFQGSLREFLKLAATPDFAGGSWLLSRDSGHFFDGEVLITRLSAGTNDLGPVAVEFLQHKKQESPSDPTPAAPVSSVDANNPNPVLLVNEDGRVIEYNQAALDISSKLASAPLLHEILPGLEPSTYSSAIDPTFTQRFESLFGSRVHEFHSVSTANGTLLYGLRKSDTQSLQIALHQSQENFNTLCAISNDAVLMVEPHDYKVLEANLAASDLFGAVHPGLVGKAMEEFADWPWQDDHLRASVQLQRVDGSVVQCSFEHELIKVEGEPTLLVVVTRAYDAEQRDVRQLADYTAELAERLSDQVHREPEPTSTSLSLPIGPGMLVVTNPTVRDVARRMLEHLGHECEVFTNLDDATIWLVRSDVRPEFVMIDLGDFDQPEDWVEMLRTRCGEVPCVGLSDNDLGALPNGPNSFLSKPFELEDIAGSLQELDLSAELPA
ncbi:MAG: PAS domain-containing protein [Calditrichaeota bacterium]|nr:PAS domain-containing protein [Calditrichota bacterium]